MTGYVQTNGVPKVMEAMGVTASDVERMRAAGLTWPDVAARCGYRREDYKTVFQTLKYHFRKHGRAWPIEADAAE